MNINDAVHALSTGAWTPAIATFLGHLAYNDTDGAVWMYLGIAYSETGHLHAALHALHKAESITGANGELYEAIGCTYLRMNSLVHARWYLESAIQFPDSPASVYRNLSILFLKQHLIDHALTSIETALDIDADDVLSLYAKALILYHLTTGSNRREEGDLPRLLNTILQHPGTPDHIADGVRELATRIGSQPVTDTAELRFPGKREAQ